MGVWDKFYKMGLSKEKSEFKLDVKFSAPDWKKPLLPEIEINRGEFPEEFIWTDGGFFYAGRRVILYVRDQVQYFEDRVTEYKFHLTTCATITGAINRNHYKKYVLKRDASKIFQVNQIINNRAVEKELELHACKHCLSKLNWRNYKRATSAAKLRIYETFSLEEFFQAVSDDNQSNFDSLPDYTAETAPLNIYPPNWAIISKMLRKEAGYICSDCRRKITKNMHVHHKNGIKNDCTRSNLEVLCAACHQKRHSHKILGGRNF